MPYNPAMSIVDLLGLTAGVFTTAAFVPQVLKIWRSRATRDISLGMFSLFCAGLLLWIAYGFVIGSIPIITANLVTFALAFTILLFKLRFK